MKQQWKGFVSGILVTLLVLGMSGAAMAVVAQKQAVLDYNDIKITLDGKSVTPTDANGQAVEPFAIEGTTYLPVRAIANALGLGVEWDGATQTVKLSSTAVPTSETSKPAPSTGTPTLAQKNALSAAIDYINIMPFSRAGLVKQLEFEKYSHEDAAYGVDNCGADWNEQAAKKAQSYLDVMSFSRDSLIKQLEFDGFTTEQAEYGANAVGY